MAVKITDGEIATIISVDWGYFENEVGFIFTTMLNSGSLVKMMIKDQNNMKEILFQADCYLLSELSNRQIVLKNVKINNTDKQIMTILK